MQYIKDENGNKQVDRCLNFHFIVKYLKTTKNWEEAQ